MENKTEQLWKIAADKLKECENELLKTKLHLWKASEGVKDIKAKLEYR